MDRELWTDSWTDWVSDNWDAIAVCLAVIGVAFGVWALFPPCGRWIAGAILAVYIVVVSVQLGDPQRPGRAVVDGLVRVVGSIALGIAISWLVGRGC